VSVQGGRDDNHPVLRSNRLFGDADLLIAATCLHHDLTLLTTNRSYFQRIPGLRIISSPLP